MSWAQALFTVALGNTIVLVPDPAQLPSRHEVRHPVSCLRARGVRHARIEPSGADAGPRGLRLVRHPGLDRRRSAPHIFLERDPELAHAARRRLSGAHDDRVDLVPALLGPEHRDHLQGHGSAARRRELGGTVRPRDDGAPARVGGLRSQTGSVRCCRSRGSSGRSASSCRSSSRR